MKRLRITAVAVFSCGVGIAAQGRSASQAPVQWSPPILWSQTVPLDVPDRCLPVPGSVEGRGVAIAPDEDLVAVGRLAGPSTVVVVAKYDPYSGERVWCHSFQVKGTANGTTFLVAAAEVGGVAIDSSGTIFVAGQGRTTPSPPPSPSKPGPPPPVPAERYFVTKCTPIGVCNSAVTFINPPIVGSHNDTVGDIAIGPDGNPVLTGLAEFPSAPKKSTFKLLTVKVNGQTLQLLGTALASTNPPSAASTEGVAVDSSNDILVTGTEASTLKYDSSLSPTPLWTARLAGAKIAAGKHDEAPGEVDDVVVLRAAAHGVTGAQGFGVARLQGETGVTLWTKTYGSGLNDVPRDVVLDHRGNILVAGEGQLVSLSRTGELNWATLSRTSLFAVAVGLDGDPVVSGYSEVRGGPGRVMHTLQYDSSDANETQRGTHHEGSDRGKGPRENRLAWDEPASSTVAGFRVCIDEQTGTGCQDVGLPEARILPSTTPGMVTYEIAVSKLTLDRPGKRRISVIAYSDAGNSPAATALTVAGRYAQHSEEERR